MVYLPQPTKISGQVDGRSAMTVYVDDMYLHPVGRFGRMKMSHLIADTRDELLSMVDTIGVERKWLQKPGKPGEHFDIAQAKRLLAIAAGAVPITMRQLSCMTVRRGTEGSLGLPAEAEDWLRAYFDRGGPDDL